MKDILGNEIKIGDKVVIFGTKFVKDITQVIEINEQRESCLVEVTEPLPPICDGREKAWIRHANLVVCRVPTKGDL